MTSPVNDGSATSGNDARATNTATAADGYAPGTSAADVGPVTDSNQGLNDRSAPDIEGANPTTDANAAGDTPAEEAASANEQPGFDVGAPAPSGDAVAPTRSTVQNGGGTGEPPAEQQENPRDVLTGDDNNEYEVAEGDTLESLAERFYGSPGAWQQIWQANVNRDGGWPMPSMMPVGERIIIP